MSPYFPPPPVIHITSVGEVSVPITEDMADTDTREPWRLDPLVRSGQWANRSFRKDSQGLALFPCWHPLKAPSILHFQRFNENGKAIFQPMETPAGVVESLAGFEEPSLL